MSKNMTYTNSLTGISKDDILCEFAYMLFTAPKGSDMAETADIIYDAWRKRDIKSQGLSEKQIKKYRMRCLSDSEVLPRIAAVLKEAATDDGLKYAIVLRVLVDFSDYIVRRTGAFESDADTAEDWSSPEEKMQTLTRIRSRLNWGKIRVDWGAAIAYIRTFSDKEGCKAELKKRGIYIQGIFSELIDLVYGDSEFIWFIDRSKVAPDKQRITKYTNQSEFYRTCINLSYERLIELESEFMFASASNVYGAYRGYTLETLSEDTLGARSAQDDLKSEEQLNSVLSVHRDKADIEMTDDVYFNYWLAKELLWIIYEHAERGVDVLAVCRAAGLSKRDATDSVKEAFLAREIWTDEIPSYKSRREQEDVTRIIARIWVQKCISKRMQDLLREKKDDAKDEKSKYRKLAESLEKEKERLEKSLERAESSLENEQKKARESEKELLSNRSEHKEALKEKDSIIARKDAEIEELKALLEMTEEEGSEEDKPDEDAKAEEAFRAYIQEHRVLIWGLREEAERRFRAKFPELSFTSSDRRLTRQQLAAYDALIIATNFTNHSNFFAARDTADAFGIPRAYMDKAANTPGKLYRALDIAVNGRK